MRTPVSRRAGLSVRRLRLSRKWTLQALSQRTGIPLSTLSKLELGQSILTQEKWTLLCNALEADPADETLSELGGAPGESPSGRRAVIRAGEGHASKLGPHDCRIVAAELLSKCFTPILIEVSVKSISEHGPMQALSGETYLHVLQGLAILHTDLYAPLTLIAGESVYFDGRVSHAIVAGGEIPCRALLVVAGDEPPATTQK